MNSTSKHRLVHNAIPCCSKSEATKKIGSAKISNSTDSTVTNGADNNSSVLKQLLISPVSSKASSTVSEVNLDYLCNTAFVFTYIKLLYVTIFTVH